MSTTPTTPEDALNRDKIARLGAVRHSMSTPSAVPTALFFEPVTPPNSTASVTMQGIATLLQQALTPVNASVESLRSDFSKMTVSVHNDMQAIGARLETIENRLDVIGVRVDKLESLIEDMQAPRRGIEPELLKRIEELEAHLTDARHRIHPAAQNDYERTAVLGGLAALSGKEEAIGWISDKLWSLYGPTPLETYCKGEFKGIMFTKFSSKGDRDAAVAKLRNSCKGGGSSVWAKPDLPLNERTLKTLTLGAKYIMEAWGWHQSDLWAEPEEGTLKLAGEMILKAAIKNGSITIEYGEGWEQYLITDRFPEMKELLISLDGKIKKGGGKGGDKASAKARKGL